jgi:Domain of unknown function (DUF4431)
MKITLSQIARAAAFAAAFGFCGQAAHGACLDLTQRDSRLTLEGNLAFQVFGGPPYNGGVNKGDTPEPTYILKLDSPVCATGDDSLDANERVDSAQVFPADDDGKAMFASLTRLVGRKVRVEGKSAFGAHTGHHHAPLLLPITAITEMSDPAEANGGAMAAVQGFYMALAEGDGAQAARFVVPEKRAAGPLSARAMSAFYGRLDEMLALTQVRRSAADEFQVRYTFVSQGNRRCDGAATVRTAVVNGESLISAIKALNGC